MNTQSNTPSADVVEVIKQDDQPNGSDLAFRYYSGDSITAATDQILSGDLRQALKSLGLYPAHDVTDEHPQLFCQMQNGLMHMTDNALDDCDLWAAFMVVRLLVNNVRPTDFFNS